MCSLNVHLTFCSVNDFATIFSPRFFLVHTSIILVEQAINAKLFIEHYILSWMCCIVIFTVGALHTDKYSNKTPTHVSVNP